MPQSSLSHSSDFPFIIFIRQDRTHRIGAVLCLDATIATVPVRWHTQIAVHDEAIVDVLGGTPNFGGVEK